MITDSSLDASRLVHSNYIPVSVETGIAQSNIHLQTSSPIRFQLYILETDLIDRSN
jgi:hypothetical protein